MNVYLACTVRGHRGGIAAARALADLIERHGHTVLTRHLLEDDVDTAEAALTEREVFARDLRWLDSADLLIAEASGSSYGVGFEVGYVLGRAADTSQRVLLLYDGARRPHLSRLIAGVAHHACTSYAYEDENDLMTFVGGYLNRAVGDRRSGELVQVRVRRLRPVVQLPSHQTPGAAGFDLAAVADVLVPPGEVRLIPTGLVLEVPAGMFLGIFARSSTPLKRGLMVANGVGVVDPDYCGPDDEVKIQVLNFTRDPVEVKAGERIAQGILLPATRIAWEEVDALRSDSRGGFGATG